MLGSGVRGQRPEEGRCFHLLMRLSSCGGQRGWARWGPGGGRLGRCVLLHRDLHLDCLGGSDPGPPCREPESVKI